MVRQLSVVTTVGVASAYQCPGSGSGVHASMKVTATASASCADVQAEIEARAGGDGGWVDPHNGGIYSVLDSSSGIVNTQRTTNPATSVGGQVYTDKQTFVLTDAADGCKIEACSESQGFSIGDVSTNYCDLRNLYCGSSDGCKAVGHDFTHVENSHQGSIGAGHDASACIVASKQLSAKDDYTCPGSGSLVRAWMEVTATASASCADVQTEIEARAGSNGGWVDPHNGGVYSVLDSSSGTVNTQRTTNPATSVGGQVYTDKQTFVLKDVDGGCQIKGCSESQGFSVGDFSTNYCDMRNLYCGSADGCTPVSKDFSHAENSHKGSVGAGHDPSVCIVSPQWNEVLEADAREHATWSKYTCPGSGSLIHAWMEVTAKASASCEDVQAEIEARASGNGFVDPHNGGIYSVLDSSPGVINTQRTTNPATSVGGQVYVDKQTFVLTDADGGCKIMGCSESQGFSVGDFSTNYCDLRNLYCGSADGCAPVSKDFSHTETCHTGSIGSGHDSGICIATSSVSV